MLHTFLQMDGNILVYIQNHWRSEWLNPVMTHITWLGNKGILWVLLTMVLFASYKKRDTGLYCLLSLILSVIFVNLCLKHFVDRTRPYEVVQNLHTLVPHPKDASFPSGHASSSFAFATTILQREKWQLWLPAFLMAGLISFSRLYVGVHYPTDVLAGILMGVFSSLTACYLLNRFLPSSILQEKK